MNILLIDKTMNMKRSTLLICISLLSVLAATAQDYIFNLKVPVESAIEDEYKLSYSTSQKSLTVNRITYTYLFLLPIPSELEPVTADINVNVVLSTAKDRVKNDGELLFYSSKDKLLFGFYIDERASEYTAGHSGYIILVENGKRECKEICLVSSDVYNEYKKWCDSIKPVNDIDLLELVTYVFGVIDPMFIQISRDIAVNNVKILTDLEPFENTGHIITYQNSELRRNILGEKIDNMSITPMVAYPAWSYGIIFYSTTSAKSFQKRMIERLDQLGIRLEKDGDGDFVGFYLKNDKKYRVCTYIEKNSGKHSGHTVKLAITLQAR